MKYLINKDSLFYIQREVWDDTKEYGEDFKEVIKQRENNQIPFLHTSPQIAYRPGLVNYLRKICQDRKFSHCCLHLAVYLLDTFMDCHNVGPDKILLLANVCLLLAAKFEENLTNVPKISDLNAWVDYRYPVKEYKDWEVIVLDYFCWYIMFPTVAHYTHYYMQAVISKEDSIEKCESVRSLFYRIHEYIVDYLDQIIDNIHYMQDFKPSQLAAGLIAASRQDCGLFTWTTQLAQLTDYSYTDIQPVLYTVKINRYNQKIEPMLDYSKSFACTFGQSFCERCGVICCPKCYFLRKI